MPEKEGRDRFRRNMEFSTRLTVSMWAIQVLNDLKATQKVADRSDTMVLGFGMGYKVMNIVPGCRYFPSPERGALLAADLS